MAWDERVLNGPPRIPYLHMTEVRSPRWRSEWAVTERDSEDRLDEASRIIRSAGGLIPVIVWVDDLEFERILKKQFSHDKRQKDRLEPDYICFLCYTYIQLKKIRDQNQSVEKVDFYVERNTDKITKQ